MRNALSAITFMIILPATAASATHEVKMLTRGESGSMVYEPAFLQLNPGDKVRFVATQPSHNVASIPEIWPEDAAQVKAPINAEIEITFETPGLYGIKCSPHYTMGMVMLIAVAPVALADLTVPATLPPMARDRLTGIVRQMQPE
ncbi:pseudoazurin [Phaeovulum sp. W22_SRMD_FR3]|uniref:pseudoazurin n=1 Tax=Phaeovulum sp. W22_SRMD_FR3 TaxID=3240274 RepID=UPI003F9D938F